MMNNKIAFLHPDLGIGGAERAIVDAAMALKLNGFKVTMITNHHDASHCFDETKNGDLNVVVVGQFLPRSIFGRLCAFFAYLRLIFAALYIILFNFNDFDLIYIDQISAPIPLLKIFGFKVLFYAHFPDMLLSKRNGIFKQIYRIPIDFIEKISLSFADIILYNSEFTANVYREHFAFTRLSDPLIVYPVPNIDNLRSSSASLPPIIEERMENDFILFLSINRYEHKKNIELGLLAFAKLRKEFHQSDKHDKLIFVHFGGYDDLVTENRKVFRNLNQLIIDLEIDNCAFLLKSCANDVKVNFLKRASALLYTPSNEHFGIVPVEAMYLKCPVIAVNSGGPRETVVDGLTGFLCESDPDAFSESMKRLIVDENLRRELGEAGHQRACEEFSFKAFQKKLSNIVSELIQ